MLDKQLTTALSACNSKEDIVKSLQLYAIDVARNKPRHR